MNLRDDVIDGLHGAVSIKDRTGGKDSSRGLHPLCQPTARRFKVMSTRNVRLSDMACKPCRREQRRMGYAWDNKVAVFFEAVDD